MRSSMSRKGNCWDNAPTESLWGSLAALVELVWSPQRLQEAAA
jgi:transposase InsO family protein